MTCAPPPSGVIMHSMSDHDICFSIQELSHAKQPKSEVYTRKITEAKSKTFCELSKAADWSQVIATSEPNSAFLQLHSNLEECYNEAFPLCNSSFNKRYNAINPWMSKALLVSRRTKERLYVKRRQKGDTGQYKEYDRVYRKAVIVAKTAYYAEQFESNASNLRKTWGLVWECQGKSQVRDAIPSSFNCNGEQVVVDFNIANGFNEFFARVGPELARKFDDVDPKVFEQYLPPSLCRDLHFLQSNGGHGAQIPWRNAK